MHTFIIPETMNVILSHFYFSNLELIKIEVLVLLCFTTQLVYNSLDFDWFNQTSVPKIQSLKLSFLKVCVIITLHVLN